jgi:outer membrane protein assembly factor BamB
MRQALLAVIALLLASTTAVQAETAALAPTFGEWPQWQGPNRDAVSTETGLLQEWPEAGPALVWKASGLGRGLAGISIQNGRIYTMGARDGQECVIALSLKDEGKELWCTPVGKLADNLGKPGARCTPAADGDFVYALGSYGDLACLRALDGSTVWQKSFPKDFGGAMMSGWGFSESPLVDGERLICTPGGKDAMMVALNKKTGEEIWRCRVPDLGTKGKDGAGYSSIVISHGAGKKQYVQSVGKGLIGVSADDGKFLWGYNKIASPGANITTPAVVGDYVFGTNGYGSGSALLKLVPSDDGVNAEEVYYLPASQFSNHHGGVVIVGDYLYGGNGQNLGNPTCIEWKTGKIVWGGKRGPGSGSAAIGYADGRLYFRYEDGLMALIDATPEGYNLRSTFKIPGVTSPSWPHPVIAGGKLYLREQDALLCYNVKAGPLAAEAAAP